MTEYARKGIKALVFDFDGTLAVPTLDFAEMRRAAIEAMARHVAAPDRPELPTMELLALVGTESAAARRGRAAALQAIRDLEVAAAKQSALFPFVRPMLARLKKLGLAMAIITRNCPEAVDIVFPDAADHGPLLTRDDVPHVKPDPRHLTAALDQLRVVPEHALMVGDHPMDVEVGKRAGTLTAAVASGGYALRAFAANPPDYVALDGNALMRMLNIL